MIDARQITNNLGGRWHNGKGQAPCPVCQPERRKDQNALSISCVKGKLLLHCFKSGCGIYEIASAGGFSAPGSANEYPKPECAQDRPAEKPLNLKKARSIWKKAGPIEGTKAEAYLRGRCITAPLPDTLRFMPDIFHTPSSTWACAMIANVEPTGGVHRTYFTKQGIRLTKSEKMMLGPCSGGAVRLSEGPGPLVVCAGIETGLSLLSGLLSGPSVVWAALSTGNMKNLILPEVAGKLTIATDGDNAGKVAGDVLAERTKKSGWQVKLLPAPNGRDWNDVLTKKSGLNG